MKKKEKDLRESGQSAALPGEEAPRPSGESLEGEKNESRPGQGAEGAKPESEESALSGQEESGSTKQQDNQEDEGDKPVSGHSCARRVAPDELERMLREAYVKGRNDAIEGMHPEIADAAASDEEREALARLFRRRPSVWES